MEPANLLGGTWRAPRGDRTIERVHPTDGRPSHVVTVSSPDDVADAVAVASRAAAGWAATPAAERGTALRRWSEALRERRHDLAAAQAEVLGLAAADCLGAADAAADGVAQFAQLGPVHRGRALAGDPGAVDVQVHVARGVVAVIVPWNDPVPLVTQAVAANLAVGNVVVVKPSERATPPVLAALRLLVPGGTSPGGSPDGRGGAGHGASIEPLVPPGVVGVVLGDGETGRRLVADERVGTVLHTGAVDTGREIAVACARRGAKAILELGGKDPLIVDGDVDPAWAAEQAAVGAFANSGQVCVSVERIYVVDDVYGPFVEGLVEQAEKRGEMPLVDESHRAAVHGHVAAALATGARAACGGHVPDRPGSWYPATVLVDVDEGMAVVRDETFGPVAPVRRVASFDEALTLAAGSPYGLAATVLTRSHEHALRAARTLPVGTVKVNAVFGGAPGGSAEPHGASGHGVGYGPELLDELSRWRVVHWSPPAAAG